MVATPDSLEHPSSPALPASARPTSLDHGSTMEITSALPDLHLDEAQAPDSPVTPEKENQSDGSTEGPAPMSSPVQFIGINYFPPSPIDVQTTSQPQPPGPTPWESGAMSPLSEDYVVVGLPTFPPKIPTRKVRRGGVPVSSYSFGPPGRDLVYYTPPMGRIGVHHPREIVRVERDYAGGEIVQFSSVYPMELEGRITPRQFMESINAINEILISAYSLWHSVIDNGVEIFSLQLSRLVISTHYDRVCSFASGREMKRLQRHIDDLNRQLFNLAGLNMLWPRKVGFLFVSRRRRSFERFDVLTRLPKLEIEYYVSWHLCFLGRL
ncbi:Golgin subfamily A member 7/ERF4 family domain containing protein [Russula decolorans]